jgi:hypothetical protein
MHCHENNAVIAGDRTVGAGKRVAVSNYPGTTYKFRMPLTPALGIVIAESQRTVLAPTYSPAPGATPGGWTQSRRLVPDFQMRQYSQCMGLNGRAVWQ